MKIHGYWHILVGILVVIISVFAFPEPLFFVYLGLIFIAWGFVRLWSDRKGAAKAARKHGGAGQAQPHPLRGPLPEMPAVRTHPHHIAHYGSRGRAHPHEHIRRNAHKVCARCRRYVSPADHVCVYCGSRLH